MHRPSWVYSALLMSAAAFAGDLPTADRDFVLEAAAGATGEVEAGALAKSKGAAAEVRHFGATMVRDHARLNAKLKAFAARKKISLPSTLDAKQLARLKELQSKTGAEFDRAYVRGQIADHEATRALLEREIRDGQDADARALAEELLPTVMAHLQHAWRLSGTPTVSVADSRRPRLHQFTG